ncbi:MAG: homoserine O-succinyltransferase [Parvularculaceae bacterium]|nr:homoserine O-succinyltransferase [Parvularculaceae bacterium]
MTAVSRLLTEERDDAVDAGCDVGVLLPADFALESGDRLSRPEIVLRIYGDRALPKVLVAGGISAGRAVADHGREKGWWRAIVNGGGAVDLNDFCVIGFDFLPNVGEAARTISTGDQARALARALDAIKVAKLHAFVGASYGGMVALAFAEAFPHRLERLCVLSAADRPQPAATALRGVQRRIVAFARRVGAAEEGVSLARQLAMIAYRTPEEFAARFAHESGAAAGDPYDVCRYLISRGGAFRMSAERYVTLSDSIDRHAIDPRKVKAPALFLASLSDRLVPPEDIERLSRQVERGAYVAFNSLYGHDAFLKETATIGPVIKSFIEEAQP